MGTRLYLFNWIPLNRKGHGIAVPVSTSQVKAVAVLPFASCTNSWWWAFAHLSWLGQLLVLLRVVSLRIEHCDFCPTCSQVLKKPLRTYEEQVE